jgi:hypothetical protein
MKPDRVRVLYIAGQGRSGSTILGDTLGQIEGFTHIGECLEIWSILLSGTVPCGCGVPVAKCEKWDRVLKAAYPDFDTSFIKRMLAFRNSAARDRRSVPAIFGSSPHTERLAQTLGEIEKLYRSIREVFGCEVIVESSKHPMYAYLLQRMDGIEPYVLHLTRDPRAAAYSFVRKRIQHGNLTWAQDRAPFHAALRWNYKNSVIELLGKRFRHRPLHLRYEDFTANPRRSLEQVLRFVGVSRASLPIQNEHGIHLDTQHTVCGNPSRFVRGNIELQQNLEWETEFKLSHRLLVTAMTLPLLIKYGYPVDCWRFRRRPGNRRDDFPHSGSSRRPNAA